MFHHVQLSVSDFKRSLQFWRDALEPLGFVAQDLEGAGQHAWSDGNSVEAEVG